MTQTQTSTHDALESCLGAVPPSYTAGGEDCRYANALVDHATDDARYLATLIDVLDAARVIRESSGGRDLLIRVVTYDQPGTGREVWAVDYRVQGDCQVAEYATQEEAEDDYQGQVEAAVAYGGVSPFDTTDVRGVPTGA